MKKLLSNIRDEFPTLVNNPGLAYFDSAASTQTHTSVLKAMNEYYEQARCNVHRGDYALSRTVSDQCDLARVRVAELINAKPEQIIFTAGATEGMNIVASWSQTVDKVIVTDAEHSANIMPWLMQGRNIQNGRLIVLPVDPDGTIDLEATHKIFSQNVGALLSVIGTSNVTGSDTQWQTLAGMAKQYGMTTCVDVCQTVGSHKFDVTQADIDFAVFSGHKMYGPVGIGALYVKHDVNELRAVRSGGGTVNHYDLAGNIEWVEGPEKHEPGTPNIAGIIGMGVAAEWINYIGYEEISNKIREVSSWLHEYQIHNIAGLRPLHYDLQTALLPELASVSNIISFVPTAHPSDIGAILGSRNVAVRAGKLCAHPCVNKYSSKGVLRVSWSIYNTKEDCKLLVEELCKAIQKLT